MYFISFFEVIFALNAFIIVFFIVLEKRKPEKTIAWLLILMLLPPLGIMLYLLIGMNWKYKRLNKSFSTHTKEMISSFKKESDDTKMIPLIKLLAHNSNSPLFKNNEIKIFKDGIEKFQMLKNEIEKAQHHIHLEYFIVKSDMIGNQIKDLLIKKSKEGVKVRFIIDKIGSSKTKKTYFSEMSEAGIDVVLYSYFLAPLFKNLHIQINYRNHKKIVVIDGKVGFIGGINIGDEYLGKGKLGYWRDTHIMVKGDFVLGLQAIFFDDFLSIKKYNAKSIFFGNALNNYYPSENDSIGKMIQFCISGPDSDYPAIMQSTLKMLSMAEKNIYISTPYFVPPENIMETLKVAALSGIDVRILFPGKCDHYPVYQASLTYLHELCKAGVKIYFYPNNSFLHAKVITIDGKISSIGSANMDIRSYLLNHELSAVIYDADTTCIFDNMFHEDTGFSTPVSCSFFDNFSLKEKLTQSIARIFSSLM